MTVGCEGNATTPLEEAAICMVRTGVTTASHHVIPCISLRRSEPRRALAILHKAEQSLPSGDGGCEAARLEILREFIQGKRHV